MKTQLYFQIYCKQLEIQTFHSQAKVVEMFLEASVKAGKDKRREDNIKKRGQNGEGWEEGRKGRNKTVLQGFWQTVKQNT